MKNFDSNKIIAIGTVSLAIGTFLLALLTFGLWRDASRNTQILLAGQRAWIGPRDVEPLKESLDGLQYTEIRLPYENVGKEPATNVRIEIHAGVLKTSDFRNVPVVEATILNLMKGRSCDAFSPDENGTVSYPGAKTDVALAPFTADRIEKVRSGKYFPIIVACFIYKIVETVRFSQFCNILEPIAEAPKWRSTACLTGNRAN